jgi:hypothetical protein
MKSINPNRKIQIVSLITSEIPPPQFLQKVIEDFNKILVNKSISKRSIMMIAHYNNKTFAIIDNYKD